MPRIKRLYRRMTAEELARQKKLRAAIEKEKPAIETLANRLFAHRDLLRTTLAALKAARESKGLSLDEVGVRSGIGKPNLSRLENARNPNPKFDTLARYAQAIGMQLKISVTQSGILRLPAQSHSKTKRRIQRGA
jgi:DNA-binding phage protein